MGMIRTELHHVNIKARFVPIGEFECGITIPLVTEVLTG